MGTRDKMVGNNLQFKVTLRKEDVGDGLSGQELGLSATEEK